MIFRCEPGYPEVADLVRRERPPAEGTVTVNDGRLGNDQNMRAAVEDGFATGADFVIAAEDDVLVAADLLEYMLAMAARYAADKSVLAVTAWQGKAAGPLDEVQRIGWFYGGACWGMWRDWWDEGEGRVAAERHRLRRIPVAPLPGHGPRLHRAPGHPLQEHRGARREHQRQFRGRVGPPAVHP